MQVAHILKAKGTAVHSVPPETTIGDVVHSLSRKRVGAVLVLANDGRIAGIISIGDVVKSRLEELSAESDMLRNYIVGA